MQAHILKEFKSVGSLVFSAEPFDHSVEGANVGEEANVSHFIKQVESMGKAARLEVAVEKDIEGNEVDGDSKGAEGVVNGYGKVELAGFG